MWYKRSVSSYAWRSAATCYGLYYTAQLAFHEHSPVHGWGDAAAQIAGLRVATVVGAMARRKLHSDLKHAEEQQHKLLMSIIKARKDTVYGREFQFHLVSDRDAFKVNVPLSSAEARDAWIERCKTDATLEESDVRLAKENPEALFDTGRLSGAQRRFDAEMRAAAFSLISRYWPELTLGTQRAVTVSSRNEPMGRFERAVTGTVALPADASDAEARYAYAVTALADSKLGLLSASTVDDLIDLHAYLSTEWERLVSDVAMGRAAPDRDISAGTRAAVDAVLSRPSGAARVDRASELGRIFLSDFGMRGSSVVRAPSGELFEQLWPSLGAVAVRKCDEHVTPTRFEFARDVVDASDRVFPLTLATAFGTLAVNMNPKNLATGRLGTTLAAVESAFKSPLSFVLHPRAAVFEFLTAEELAKETPMTVFGDQVTMGEEYELVVTTRTGSHVRHRTGIWVRPVGRHHSSGLEVQVVHAATDALGEAVRTVQLDRGLPEGRRSATVVDVDAPCAAGAATDGRPRATLTMAGEDVSVLSRADRERIDVALQAADPEHGRRRTSRQSRAVDIGLKTMA